MHCVANLGNVLRFSRVIAIFGIANQTISDANRVHDLGEVGSKGYNAVGAVRQTYIAAGFVRNFVGPSYRNGALIGSTRACRCHNDQRQDRKEREFAEREYRSSGPLCESSVSLRVSVVKFGLRTFTMEAQRSTEITQRSTYRNQNPATFSALQKLQAAARTFTEKEFPLRPEHPCTTRSKAATAPGQVSWLLHRRFFGGDLHIGPTARRSHPLPSSSRP